MTLTTMLYRTADVDVSGDGRSVEGLAFLWNHPSRVTDDNGRTHYREAFHPGSVARTLRQRSTPRPLFVAHAHIGGSVGETTFTPSAEGLVFAARVYDGTLPQAALERVNSGELRAVSVGFRPIVTRTRRDREGEITERAEISLDELSLAAQGQHDGAAVLSVRAGQGTPRLDQLRRRRSLLVVPR